MRTPTRRQSTRAGAASLNYVLILCIVLPLGAVTMGIVPRLIHLAFEWMQVLIAWPFS